MWSYQAQNAYGELWTAIGHDKKNEVIILTCQDPYWIVQRSDPTSFDEVEDSPDPDVKYDCNLPDTMNFVENFINDIEVPVIAAINGIGQHYEFALMADIAMSYPGFFFSDAHFSQYRPGRWHELLLPCVLLDRSGLPDMADMEPKIDAQTALQWGFLNEIVEHYQLIPRAYEIAEHIMKTGRAVRRLTRRTRHAPLEAVLQDDERVHVLAEMYAVQLQATRHNFEQGRRRLHGRPPTARRVADGRPAVLTFKPPRDRGVKTSYTNWHTTLGPSILESNMTKRRS